MTSAQFRALLHTLSTSVFPVLGPDFGPSDYCPLDLSLENPELKNVDLSQVSELGAYVHQVIKDHAAKVAYGGYIEKRGIYQRSTYFNQSDPDTERNIHLGLDLWIEADTPIYAPLDGVLHSFKNNTNFGDYGPTLILEHNFENQSFYTLYGHLSLESLLGKQKGLSIKKGAQIASLGEAEINGSYPPHLHFQIIKDLKGNFGDYPGVSNLKELEFYKENCPNPNDLLQLGH